MSCGYNCENNCLECDYPDLVFEYVKGYNKALDDIIKALGNYWGKKEAEEFKEWFENTTDEFYQ